MLADCLAGDRCFGVIYSPTDEDARDIAPGQVGCVTRIEDATELPDGRSNITVMGTERFELVGLADVGTSYAVASIRDFIDCAEPSAPLAELARSVRETFDRVGRAARTLTDASATIPPLADEPALLSFRIASLLDMDVETRQQLLASRSPTARLLQLSAMLSAAVAPLEQRAATHGRAKTNGGGPHASV